MKSINDLHRKYCPGKSLSNFWRSIDYHAAEQAVSARGETPKTTSSSGTQVHTLIAAAFLRWADPERFYNKLAALL